MFAEARSSVDVLAAVTVPSVLTVEFLSTFQFVGKVAVALVPMESRFCDWPAFWLMVILLLTVVPLLAKRLESVTLTFPLPSAVLLFSFTVDPEVIAVLPP